ncbi:T-complex protein 1 subunit delta [Glycine soja]
MPSADMVKLCDIKIMKKLGGTVDDTELVKGLNFVKEIHTTRGPTYMEKTKDCCPPIPYFVAQTDNEQRILWSVITLKWKGF